MKKNLFLLAIVSLVSMVSMQAKAQLPASATDVSPLLVGEKIPDGTLVDAQGKSVSVYDLTKEKPTVIVFYRGEWCPNCIKNFQNEYKPNLAEIEQMGYNLITICPDAPAGLQKTSSETGMDAKYFFGDGTGAFSKAMGLAFQQQDRMKERLATSSGGKNTDPYLAIPAFYVVNTSQEIIYADLRPNAIPADKRTKWSLAGPVLQALKQ